MILHLSAGMPDAEQIETVDAEPVLALDTPLAGYPAELPARDN